MFWNSWCKQEWHDEILGRDLYWNLGKGPAILYFQKYFILHIHYKLWIVAETVLLTGSFDAFVCIFAQSLCSEFVRVRILHNVANIFQFLCSNFTYQRMSMRPLPYWKSFNFNCRSTLGVEKKRWAAGNLQENTSLYLYLWKRNTLTLLSSNNIF